VSLLRAHGSLAVPKQQRRRAKADRNNQEEQSPFPGDLDCQNTNPVE
jgi:hypothetical protein